MTMLFAHHLERRAEIELRRHALQLVAGLDGSAKMVTVVAAPVDPRFAVPGSGLYWQIVTMRGVIRSRSLWDQSLGLPHGTWKSADWSIRSARGPFEQHIYILERAVKPLAGGGTVLVQVAEEEGSIHAARVEFGQELLAFLSLLWLVLVAAAWGQVRLGLSPLTRLRQEVIALRSSPSARLSDQHPIEVAPLVDAINGLIGIREADVRRARQRAADLAHALKTPLAALVAQRRLLGEGCAGAAEGFDRALASAQASVEAELARARAALARHAAAGVTSHPAIVCNRLISVLERTDKGMNTLVDNDLDAGLSLPVGEEDLTELLGPLLDNAVKFARRRVVICGNESEGLVALDIEDDGPGLDADSAERAMARGARLDERGAGHGLGLAIARDLAEATGASISLSRSVLGGLRVRLCWRDARVVGERKMTA
jgi:signal transduction histidine kinase